MNESSPSPVSGISSPGQLLDRRHFIGAGGALALGLLTSSQLLPGADPAAPAAGGASSGALEERFGIQNCPMEWSLRSGKAYNDPFNDLELDVIITTPSGEQHRVPAFWGGGSLWRVRYAPPVIGRYTYSTVCSDAANGDLHQRAGAITVTPYTGTNPLYQHGGLRVRQDRRHLEHADGTPFFWLGDTWWMGLCQRMPWPDGFQTLTADRVRKGFTVIQIVAGLYPDMPPFDPRGANEAGFPWEKDYARINPAYFDAADSRIEHLADHGLVSCIVASWGYFLSFMGMQKMKQHWRYLIARWGAYPTVWCLAGEGGGPYYLSTTRDADAKFQRSGWTEMAGYVRGIDPYHRPVTIHPGSSSRETLADQTVIDIDMMQTGHSDRDSIPNTIESIRRSLSYAPKMPALVGEACYEGIMEANRQEVQRFVFWACLLTGAGGHTYGANGIWQVNTRDKPFGPSPHGHSWGGPPWEVAAQLPGSTQVGLGKAVLERYSWWLLEPHPEMIRPHWDKNNYWAPFAGYIPGEAFIAYLPTCWSSVTISGLQAGSYRAVLVNPSDLTEVAWGTIQPDATGTWKTPEFPIVRDWILVLDKKA